MKNLAKILLCGLFVPVNMAFGDFDLYYDTNGVCSGESTSLWCANKPAGGACCSGDYIVSNLATHFTSNANRDGYSLRGWTSEPVVDVYTSADSLGDVLVINKKGGMKGSISTESALYAAWARECVDSSACQLYVDANDGHVEYIPLCDTSTHHQDGSGWDITCEQNTPDDEILSITYNDNGNGCVSFPNDVFEDSCVEGGNYTLWSAASGRVHVNEGFELKGWTDVERHTLELGGSYPCGEYIGTLIAFCKNVYDISYNDGDHGSVNYTGAVQCEEGESIQLANGDIVTPSSGYVFYKWKMGNELKNPGDSVLCTSDVSNITAQYVRSTHTITYDIGSYGTFASGYSATTTCEHGDSYSLYPSGAVVVNDPTRTFNGWQYNGQLQRPGASFSCDGDKTFQASYSPKQQWVKFNLDDMGATAESAPQNFWCQMNPEDCYGCYQGNVCSSGAYTGLSVNPTKTYYEYLGHYLTQGDRASVNPGGGVESDKIIDANGNLTSEWQNVGIPDSGVVTIYAHWKQRTYTVTYDYSGCWSSESMPTSCSISETCPAGESFALREVDDDCIEIDHVFGGWDKGQPGNPVLCSSNNIKVKANCQYYPKSVNSGIINLKGFTSSN